MHHLSSGAEHLVIWFVLLCLPQCWCHRSATWTTLPHRGWKQGSSKPI